MSEGNQLSFEKVMFEYHDVFSLEEDGRAETDMIEFEISTGDELPKKQATRRVPYATCQDAEQLKRIHKIVVIKTI